MSDFAARALQTPSGEVISFFGALLFSLAALYCGALLASGDEIYSSAGLIWTYAGFASSVILAVHFWGLFVPLSFGARIGKRVPKYLDYAYITLIAFGFAEIVNFAPKYYTYLLYTGPNQQSVLASISALARSETTGECGKPQRVYRAFRIEHYIYYPPDYCRKLQTLAHAGTKLFDASIELSRDRAFMDYVPEYTIIHRPPAPGLSQTQTESLEESDQPNPITYQIRRTIILNTFKGYAENGAADAVLKWVSMLLLPLGIALRLLKTSMELFADAMRPEVTEEAPAVPPD